jgi:hypothetical protein
VTIKNKSVPFHIFLLLEDSTVSLSQELGDAAGRFRSYVDSLIELLQRHEVHSISGLISAFRTNELFSSEWRRIWGDIAKADGGKISFTTLGAILGAVLGGVGIAAAGGAIGLPLALVLGLGGLIAGTEVDALRTLSKTKMHLLRIPKNLHARIEAAALAGDCSINELMVQALATTFPEPEAL